GRCAQPGRRQRGDGLRRLVPRPRALLLPEQPLRDLRAGRGAGHRAHRAATHRVRDPLPEGRRQRCARGAGRLPARGPPPPLRQGADVHRGRHLPARAPHHERRPHPLPRRGGAPTVAAALPAGPPGASSRAARRPRRGGARRGGAPQPRGHHRDAGGRGRSALPGPGDHVRARAVHRAPGPGPAARGVPRLHRLPRPRADRGGCRMTTTTTMAAALNAALRDCLGSSEGVVLIGEDIGTLGGVFRITDGLKDAFGPARVIDSPLAESGIIGTSVGMAYRGMRPVCEIQFDGFVHPGFDQIVAQVSRLHYRTGGRVRMPLTIRIPFGGGIGAAEHHSESPEAYFAHAPGLRVVTVADPQDAYSTMRAAIECDDPVMMLEPKRRYWSKGEVDPSVTADLSSARVLREGRDATLVAYG